MKVYIIQLFLGLSAVGLFISNPKSSYMNALIITCSAVAIAPFLIGYPTESVYENDKRIIKNGKSISKFLHNNLIYIFVGSTFIISQAFIYLD